MTVLKTILTIVIIVVSIAVSIIILFQEGKQAGLGSISGQTSNNESYWNKKHNKN